MTEKDQPDQSANPVGLRNVCQVPRFTRSANLPAMLQYLVESIAGGDETPKELVTRDAPGDRHQSCGQCVDSTVRSEVRRLRNELSARTSDLQRVSDLQAVLLGMIGHDLRQPLQVIQSTYEWLESRVGGMEKARIRRGERAIARLSEHLNSLVGAMCLFQRTSSIDVTAVSVMHLLQRIGSVAKEDALAKGVELRVCPTSAQVMSHPLLLEGIMRNLVSNAIKYTQSGGRVLIGCRRSGQKIRIDVLDTGIGLSAAQLSGLFKAFQRVHATRCDGLGIGLFVVRRAVELLGHEMAVSSTPSRGSRFSVLAWTPCALPGT
jgi:signal transduction histidine kinase